MNDKKKLKNLALRLFTSTCTFHFVLYDYNVTMITAAE